MGHSNMVHCDVFYYSESNKDKAMFILHSLRQAATVQRRLRLTEHEMRLLDSWQLRRGEAPWLAAGSLGDIYKNNAQ